MRNGSLYSAVCFLLLTIATSVCRADDFEDGLAAAFSGDFPEAARLFQRAADQGHAEAQLYLGLMYKEGKGLPRNEKEAAERYRLAAQQGNAEAQFNLGLMYYEGQGLKKDYAESVKWYRLAAKQGNAYAQANLGHMYEHGYGVPQDHVRAHMWFDLAALVVGDQVGEELSRLANPAADLMTSQQIAEAKKMAKDCLANKYQGCD